MKIKRLFEGIKAPSHAHTGDAGLDLRSTVDHKLHPGNQFVVPTGFAFEILTGHVGLVVPRSSVGKRGIVIANTVGVIDSTYRGEVKLILRNDGDDVFVVRIGDALAQMIIVPFLSVQCVEVDSLGDTERGEGGFGSTGK